MLCHLECLQVETAICTEIATSVGERNVGNQVHFLLNTGRSLCISQFTSSGYYVQSYSFSTLNSGEFITLNTEEVNWEMHKDLQVETASFPY